MSLAVHTPLLVVIIALDLGSASVLKCVEEFDMAFSAQKVTLPVTEKHVSKQAS